MENHLPAVYLATRGKTAWSVAGRHTGLINLPLTPQRERNGRGSRSNKPQRSSGKDTWVFLGSSA